MQDQLLLKYKDLYAFMSIHHPEYAIEIRSYYLDSAKLYYLNPLNRSTQGLVRTMVSPCLCQQLAEIESQMDP